jgi:hypothetical protein
MSGRHACPDTPDRFESDHGDLGGRDSDSSAERVGHDIGDVSAAPIRRLIDARCGVDVGYTATW